MTRPELVVFDCDGVLLDSERLTVGVEARVLTELGWPITAAEVVERWMGKSSASRRADLEEHLGADGARPVPARGCRDGRRAVGLRGARGQCVRRAHRVSLRA